MELHLQREYHDQGTNGILHFGEQFISYTIELPWRDNIRLQSCIPEGRYQLVQRISKKHNLHLMLKNVPGRSLILVHRANDAVKQLKGCIAPVTELTGISRGRSSGLAFNHLMRLAMKILAQQKPLWLLISKLPQDCSTLKINST